MGVDALLLRFAVVNTVCNIKGIKGVVIQVEGKGEVSSVTGKEIGVLTLSDIALDVNETELGKKETIASFDNGIDGIPRKNPFGPKGKPPNKGAKTSLRERAINFGRTEQ